MNDLDVARSLIGDGDIDPALSILRNYIDARKDDSPDNRMRELLDTVTLVRGQLTRADKDFVSGVLTREDRNVQLNKIGSSVLNMISRINYVDDLRTPDLRLAMKSLSPEVITGDESQLRSVGWIRRGLLQASGICRLRSKTSLGTGFLIDGNVLMTNHHVIRSAEDALNFYAEFFYEEDVDGKDLMPRSIPLDPSRLFITSNFLDVTAISLAQRPGDDVQIINAGTSNSPQVGEHVNIIQHPSGGRKQISMTNNKVVNVSEQFVQYMTDTLPGSSGSPVFNDSWQMIAIHHAGGALLKNRFGGNAFANEGTIIKRVRQDSAFASLFSV